MKKSLFLITLLYATFANAQQQTFTLPQFDYDKVEEAEGTKTFTQNGTLMLEIHYPYKNRIQYYCHASNAVYDSVYVFHGTQMKEIRFKAGGNGAGYYCKSWHEQHNLVLFEQYYADGSLKEKYQGIAQNAPYNNQAPACADDFLRTGVYQKYDAIGNAITFVNYDTGKSRFKDNNSSKKGKKKLAALKKAGDKILIDAYGKNFFKHHIKFNRTRSRGYYPNSYSYRKNKGIPDPRPGLFDWFTPTSDTITYADIAYTIFLDEDNYADIITLRLDKDGKVVDAVDEQYARKWNMTRGLIEGTADQSFLSPEKAIEYAQQNGLILENDTYILDASWEPSEKSGTTGKLYYRFLFNKYVKQMYGGRLYLYDEWLIDPFSKEIIKDREFKGGEFADLGYTRKEQRNGKYGFPKPYDPEEAQIPFEYDELPGQLTYLMIAKKDGKYGLINAKNEINIPFEYDQLIFIRFEKTRFKNDFLQVNKEGLWGLMDKDGNEILPLEYNSFRKKGENIIVGYIDEVEKVSYNFRTKEVSQK